MMLRSFIAIKIPTTLQDAIANSTAEIRSALTKPLVRWVPPHNLHLTLKFLGDVSSANLELLAQSVAGEASHHTSFSITLSDLGVFPNIKRPRIFWIGIEAPAELIKLQHSLENSAEHMGYAPEKRSFSPHLTIGRINQHASVIELQRIRMVFEQTKVGSIGTFPVESIYIYKSDLRPTGAVYTQLYSAPLSK